MFENRLILIDFLTDIMNQIRKQQLHFKNNNDIVCKYINNYEQAKSLFVQQNRENNYTNIKLHFELNMYATMIFAFMIYEYQKIHF